MPPTPNYQQAYDQTASVYQPQTDLVNSQIADLPNQEQATLSSLDQAKANAFRDINQSSNARGVMFSGVPIDQQAQYVGTKYLPAYAAAKEATTNAKTTLLGKINDINLQRSQNAQSTVNTAQAAAARASTAAAKPLTQQQTSAAIRQGLGTVRGKDGYVSPQDYAQAYADWVGSGYNGAQFDNYFGDLMNPNNGYYQYAKTQVQ